jgi:putative addiction module component (TIGR02574 family)
MRRRELLRAGIKSARLTNFVKRRCQTWKALPSAGRRRRVLGKGQRWRYNVPLAILMPEDRTMARTLPTPPPGFDELSTDEKLEYVQSLWDRIAARPEDVPIPDWHREVLEERLQAYRANPTEGRPWDEVREEIQNKLQSRRRSR